MPKVFGEDRFGVAVTKGEKQKKTIRPAVAVVILFSVIWSTYMFCHLLPMLRDYTPNDCYSASTLLVSPLHCRSIWQLVFSQKYAVLFVISYVLCVCTSPGAVPQKGEWDLANKDGPQVETHELKVSGERRVCKWCRVYKPDRCHHCRVCGTCVLRMDHHCPWIMNCVGFANHKYFMLAVIYALVSCVVNAATVWESVARSIVEEVLPIYRFMVVLCLVLSITMGALTFVFLIFHIWLMMQGMTTIEFCEKNTRQKSPSERSNKDLSYDQGLYRNFVNVFGPNPILWLLPLSLPEGDGLQFGAKTLKDASKTTKYDPEWTTSEAATKELGYQKIRQDINDKTTDKGEVYKTMEPSHPHNSYHITTSPHHLNATSHSYSPLTQLATSPHHPNAMGKSPFSWCCCSSWRRYEQLVANP